MKKIFLPLLILVAFSVTPHNVFSSIISIEANSLLREHFHQDKKFRRYVVRSFHETIFTQDFLDSSVGDHRTTAVFSHEEQVSIVNALVSSHKGIYSFNNLSNLFDVFVEQSKKGTIEDFVQNANDIQEAYTYVNFDRKHFLTGVEKIHFFRTLRDINDKGFLDISTKAVIKLSTADAFDIMPQYLSLYLVDCFLKPLARKDEWSEELTGATMSYINYLDKENNYTAWSIHSLYGMIEYFIRTGQRYQRN